MRKPDFNSLKNCNCCPRECNVDRILKPSGWCRGNDSFEISSICCHKGEEPVISGSDGICNIFFNRCNLQCIYCQNYQISDRNSKKYNTIPLNQIVDKIVKIITNGAQGVGFVSPSHFIPQMLKIISELNVRGYRQPYVYNSNGYDKSEIINSLKNDIDIYLPDLKYMDNKIAYEYSQADNYVEFATKAIKEMFSQKGVEITLDAKGYITNGLIIRHLVLPGHIENSKQVLRFIAEELSTDVYISLMSQYYPTKNVKNHPKLGRTLYPEEYQEVLDEFYNLGFHRGFIQELKSHKLYRPDFNQDNPFDGTNNNR